MKRLDQRRNIERLEQRLPLSADFSLLDDIETTTKWAGTEAVEYFATPSHVWFATDFGTDDILWSSSNEDGQAETLIDANIDARVNGFESLGNRVVFNYSSFEGPRSGSWAMNDDGSNREYLGPTMNSPVRIGEYIFFYAAQSSYLGNSIWKTDGTPDGTSRIFVDRGPQNVSLLPQLAEHRGKLYSVFQDLLTSVRFLGEIDQSTGEVRRHAVVPASGIGRLFSTQDSLLLVGGASNNQLFGYAEGSTDLEPLGNIASRVGHVPIAQLDGTTFFARAATQWWTTDGTLAGTRRFLDDSISFDDDRISIGKTQGSYLFAARKESGLQYFLSDGTREGTRPLGLGLTGYHSPIATGEDAFYVIATDPADSETGFYRIAAQTGAWELIRPVDRLGLQPIPGQFGDFTTWPAYLNGRAFWVDSLNAQTVLYEYADDTKEVRVVQEAVGTMGGQIAIHAFDQDLAWVQHGASIWKVQPGTEQMARVNYGDALEQGANLLVQQTFDGHFVHETRQGSEYQRWLVNKGQVEASLLSTESTRPASEVFSLGDNAYQLRYATSEGWGLYSLQQDLADLKLEFPLPTSSNFGVASIVIFDDRALMLLGDELWKTDGLRAGTMQIQPSVFPEIRLDSDGNVWWFSRENAIYEWPRGNAGPIKRFDIPVSLQPIVGQQWSPRFFPLDTGVVFFAADGDRNRNLWIANYEKQQIDLLADIVSRDGSIIPSFLGSTHGRAVFSTGSRDTGYSLWSTDGSPEQTFRLRHEPIRTAASPYPSGGSPGPTLLPNGDLLFSYFTRESGREIWVTDGTAAGTNLYADIAGGQQSSSARVVSIGETVLAAARTEAHGQELFFSHSGLTDPSETKKLVFWIDENTTGSAIGKVSLEDISDNQLSSVRILGNSVKFEVTTATNILRLKPGLALDFETQNTHQFELEIDYRDQQGALITRSVAAEVRVIDLIEPLRVEDQVFEIDENSPRFSFIGQIGIEGDSRIIPSFRRTGGWPFYVEQEAGIVRVLGEAWRLDYESTRQFTFPVTVTGIERHDINVTIKVIDVNESPEFENDATALDVYVSQQESQVLISAVDPEGTTVSYQLRMKDESELPSWIQFTPSTRQLTLAPPSEAIGNHELTLMAIDADGFSSNHMVAVAVIDPNTTWHNRSIPLDVNNDGVVSPSDALAIINLLNNGSGFPDNSGLNRFVDTNDDGFLSPIDALVVINYLNAAAEGEAALQERDELGSIVGTEHDQFFSENEFGPLIDELTKRERERWSQFLRLP